MDCVFECGGIGVVDVVVGCLEFFSDVCGGLD